MSDGPASCTSRSFDVGALPEGVYSIEIAPPPQTDGGSVRDVFVVVDPADTEAPIEASGTASR